MKVTRSILGVVMISALELSVAYGQGQNTYTFPPKTTYSNVLISPFSGVVLAGSAMTIDQESSSVTFITKKTKEEKSITLKEVESIRFKAGSKAGSRGLWGALSGFAAAGLLVQSMGIDDGIPGSPTSGSLSGETAAALLLVGTGAGLTIGIINGAKKANYKILFADGDFLPH